MRSNILEAAKELRKIWGAFRPARVLITTQKAEDVIHPGR